MSGSEEPRGASDAPSEGPRPIAPWTRADTRPTGRLADVALVVFHQGPLAAAEPLSLAQYGAPSRAAVDRVDVTAIQDPSWLSGWRAGGIRNVAVDALGPALATLDAADQCHFVRAQILDPFDLTHLQAAWAIARWLVGRGATVVLDAFALRFHTAAAVQAQDVAAPFDLEREVTVVFEKEPLAAQLGHVVHTRGLGKLARPDLVALVDPARAAATADVLRAIARQLADGFMPVPGGRAPRVEAAHALIPLPPGSLADQLHLNNDGWLVELDPAAS